MKVRTLAVKKVKMATRKEKKVRWVSGIVLLLQDPQITQRASEGEREKQEMRLYITAYAMCTQHF